MQSTSVDVSLNSKHLEDYFHRDRVSLSRGPLPPVMVNQEIIAGLSEWTESTASQILWLEGSDTEADDFENALTVIATAFINLAERSRVSVISYFCELRQGENPRPGNTREAQATVSLVYALLRQMVERLLPRFDATTELSESRFRRLDGTINSLAEALSVFRDLLELTSDSVLCVIDGFQRLDDGSTDGYLKEFLQALRKSKMKILFTTTGRSACLRDGVSTSETVIVDMLRSNNADLGLERHEFWNGE